jgi:hypothetical protein
MERLNEIGGIMDPVHFTTGRESINDMELMWIPHGREHKLLVWISIPASIAISFLATAYMHRERDKRKKLGLVAGHEMPPAVSTDCFEVCKSSVLQIPCALLSRFVCQQMQHSSQAAGFQSQLLL